MLAGEFQAIIHDLHVHRLCYMIFYPCRRGIDSLRGLDRFQCRVIHHGGEDFDDFLIPVLKVVEEAAVILNYFFSPIIIGVNVSGTNNNYLVLLFANIKFYHYLHSQIQTFVTEK